MTNDDDKNAKTDITASDPSVIKLSEQPKDEKELTEAELARIAGGASSQWIELKSVDFR